MISKNALWQRGARGLAGSLLLFVSACNREAPKASLQQLEPTLESIQREFVNPSCVRCHTEATAHNRYVSLVDLSTLIEPSEQSRDPKVRYLIKPGCPKQSFFLSILREGKMPPSGKVSTSTLETIEAFITGLDPARAQPCDDEPPD